MAGDGGGLARVDDAGPQAVADVGGQRVDLALLAIQAEGKVSLIRNPELLVKPLLEFVRLLRPVGRAVDVLAFGAEVRLGQEGRVGVALNLGEGNRWVGHRAVSERDAVE